MDKLVTLTTTNESSLRKYSFHIDLDTCQNVFDNADRYNINKKDSSYKILRKITIEDKENSDYAPILTALYHLLLLDGDIPKYSKLQFAKDFLKTVKEDEAQTLKQSDDSLEFSSIVNTEKNRILWPKSIKK